MGRGCGPGLAADQESQLAPPRSLTAETARCRGSAPGRFRRILAWSLCVAGLLAYNWWLLVLLKPGLMTSPDELFSNLEVSGQPYAAAMQHADVLAGVLLAGAFLAAGWRGPAARLKDWLAMIGFAVAIIVGGVLLGLIGAAIKRGRG